MNLQQLQTMAEVGELVGLFPGIPDDVYHHADCPGRSSSFFKTLLSESPLHAITSLSEEKDSDAMAFGRAAHLKMQDEVSFAERYTFAPEGMRRDARNKAYQEFMAASEGKTILTFEEWKALALMAKKFTEHPLSKLLKGSKVEHSGWWSEAGVLCKVRPDFFIDGVVYDYKTSAKSIGPWAFGKTVHEYGYHISAAMYLAGLSAILGEKLKRFVLIAQEKKAPFDVIYYDIPDAVIEKGNEEFHRALDIYVGCLDSGEFHGYPKDFQSIDIPAYAW